MRITSWVHISRGIRNGDDGKDRGWQAGWDGESPGLNWLCAPRAVASPVVTDLLCNGKGLVVNPQGPLLLQYWVASTDLSLIASTLFFPVLFLVLSRFNQLTSRCNPSSRCFFLKSIPFCQHLKLSSHPLLSSRSSRDDGSNHFCAGHPGSHQPHWQLSPWNVAGLTEKLDLKFCSILT